MIQLQYNEHTIFTIFYHSLCFLHHYASSSPSSRLLSLSTTLKRRLDKQEDDADHDATLTKITESKSKQTTGEHGLSHKSKVKPLSVNLTAKVRWEGLRWKGSEAEEGERCLD